MPLSSSEAKFQSLFTCKDADPQTASSSAAHDEYKWYVCVEIQPLRRCLTELWGKNLVVKLVRSKNFQTPPWTWDCTVESGRGVASPRQPLHGGRLRPWSSQGGSSLTGRREKKWLTGSTNKAWSEMWGYAEAIVQQTSQERMQNLFHLFMLLFDSALQWTEPESVLLFPHVDLLLVYFEPLYQTEIVWSS